MLSNKFVKTRGLLVAYREGVDEAECVGNYHKATIVGMESG